MPIFSMTGYASAQDSAAKPKTAATAPSHTGSTLSDNPETTPASASAQASTQLGVEIRSVNSRFLDLALRLPEEMRQLEPALRELLTAKLKRGKIELRVSVDSHSAHSLVDPSLRLLQRLSAVQDAVRVWLPQATPLGVADVLRLSTQEHAAPHYPAKDVLALAARALHDLLQARKREGERLCTMLLGHVAQLRALALQAVPLVPQLVAQQRQRFLDRWQEAMALADGSPVPDTAQDRALTEATAFAIRIDVAEEVTRLQSHLDEIERLLGKGGEVGKRLDFLIQELHREANTLGSKSSALELTHISVDMKVLIEQMREQVQNIE